MQIGFLLLMHTALGSQGEGVQGSGTVGREEGGEMIESLSMQLVICDHYNGCGSMAMYFCYSCTQHWGHRVKVCMQGSGTVGRDEC